MLDNQPKESYANKQPDAVPIEGAKKIVDQMENSICQIIKEKGEVGTGFLCNIPYFGKSIPCLITNNHILSKSEIENDKTIEFRINNELRKIKIDENRKKYTNEEKDVTFIEIKPEEDKITKFMELDEDINKNEKILEKECRNKSIYILYYQKGNQVHHMYHMD